jgi:hypothetical protein
MSQLRYCRSCSGPRPRAAVRCPWCLKDYTSTATAAAPEHLFATWQGEAPRPTPPTRRDQRSGA